MSRIKNTFNRLKKKNEKALIPYVMVGDPDLATSKEIILALEKAGCDMIELGAPFSDPLADGPVIQRAALRSLQNHTSVKDVLGLVSEVRTVSRVPLILMTYYNLIFHYGEEQFVHDAVAAGLDGIILPDLPPDEADTLAPLAKNAGLDTVFLLAPTSTDDRRKVVARASQGFIYYVSLTGVTGSHLGLQQSAIRDSVARIKAMTDKPVAVGFGISTPDQAAQVASWGADGVIVGSALVKVIAEHSGAPDLVGRVTEFARSLKQAILTAQ